MTALVVSADAVAFAAFLAAAGIIVSVPVRPEGAISGAAKVFMIVAMALYAFVMLGNVLEHSGATSALDPLEDYVEVLFPAMVLYGSHSLQFRQRENELLRSERLLKRSNDFVVDIMDTTPAGIMVLDHQGWVVFANEAARTCLDLFEDPQTGVTDHPGWRVRDERYAAAEALTDFSAFLDGRPLRDIPITVEWPNGWRRRLLLNVVPMEDAHGAVGGAMAAFVDRPSSGT